MSYTKIMAYRKVAFAPDEYYHICNRGNRKQDIFLDDHDRARFLFLLLYGQSSAPFINTGKYVNVYIKTGKFRVKSGTIDKIIKNRIVELVAFCLMDNHFHIILRCVSDSGVSKYMQKILNAYTKYFNTKYEEVGHLFSGPFRAVHIDSNEQLVYTSAYVHKNPNEISKWRNKVEKYPWSSYGDYVSENRWGLLLEQKIILDQFQDSKDYLKWCKSCVAKENLSEEYLKEIDAV